MNRVLFLWMGLHLAILSLAQQDTKAFALRFNPQHGSQYDATWISKTTMNQKIMDQQVEMNMTFELKGNYDITREGDNIKMLLVYDKLAMNMKVMGQEVVLSSDDKDSTNPMSTMLKAIRGKSLSIWMQSDGKVLKVSGAEEMLKDLPVSPEDRGSVADLMGEEAIKNMIEQSFGFYPKQAVKQGDTWNTIMNLNQPYPIQCSANYTLLKVEGKKASLHIDGSLKADVVSDSLPGDAKFNFDINGSFTGTSEVDTDSGMPLSYAVQQKMGGTMEIGGQKVPLSIQTEVIFTTTRKP